MPGVITFNDTPVQITQGIHDHTGSVGQAGYVITSDGTRWSWEDSYVDIDITDANTYIGYQAGQQNTTGSYNTGIGYKANYSSTVNKNTAVGYVALLENTTGINNTAVGADALRAAANSSSYNQFNSVIDRCTAIGCRAGEFTYTNQDCIFIGFNAQANANNTTNEIVIGSGTTGNGSNTVTIGNSSTTVNHLNGEITTNLLHLGYQDHGSDIVGISATPWAINSKYMIMQRISNGEVFLNSPSGTNLYIRNGNGERIVINTAIDFRVTTSNTGRSTTTNVTLQHNLGKRNGTGAEYYHVNAGLPGNYSWDGYPGVLSWQGNGEFRVHGNGTWSCAVRADGGHLTFTGSHDTFTPFSEEDIGKIVYSTGDYATEFKDGVKYNKLSIMDSCPIVSLTTTENDKRVIGVLAKRINQHVSYKITEVEYSNLEDKSEYTQSLTDPQVYIKNSDSDVFNRGYYNALGEGGIWVSNKNGNLENGDYITSSTIPGYGQRQNDDLLRNYTVAKITCDCDFTEIVVTTKKHKMTGSDYEYDENGNPIYENVLDAAGNETTHLKHELRYLLGDGTQITKEEYLTRTDAYIAAFVGCTYHCG